VKDPEKRWQTAHDVKLQLEWILEGRSQVGVPAPPVAPLWSRLRRVVWIAAAVFAFVAGAAWWVLWRVNRPASAQVIRLTMDIAPAEMLGPGVTLFAPCLHGNDALA